MNRPGCLSILTQWSPRRAVASWKPCIVFLSCARARFLWRCCVKQRWPSASCKSHGDGPDTSPGASLPATEWPQSSPSICWFVPFQVRFPPCSFWSPPCICTCTVSHKFYKNYLFHHPLLALISLSSPLLHLLPFAPYFLTCHLLPVTRPFLLHVSLCPHLLSSLHPFFPLLFVPLSRSEEGLSEISCASGRFGPHLLRGFLKLLSATPCRKMETRTLGSA